MAQRLRVATFNLESLDTRPPGGRPALSDRVAVLRPQLERLDADILCLQEVNGQRAKAGKGRELAALDELVSGTRYATYERASTVRRSGAGVLDLHNLVILSALPIRSRRQYWHDLVPPPCYRPVTARPAPQDPMQVAWDRPILHAAVDTGGGQLLHVFNLHLRAPRAAVIAGQKTRAAGWKSVGGWAEGYYVAAIKRGGQALEARLAIDAVFDEEPEARVVACGDFNASAGEVPMRIITGPERDTSGPRVSGRVLVPLDHQIPAGQRYSLLHDGRAVMLDHILASAAMFAACRGTELHNEGLRDEVRDAAADPGAPVSYHAPLVAAFDLARD